MTVPAVVEARPEAPDIGRRGPGPSRDPALDLVRSVALARVVLWHMFGAAWLTVFAAMPLMFFVAGSLLEASGRRHGHLELVGRRARRLLLPLWAYGAVVAAAGAVRSVADGRSLLLTPDALGKALTWVLPLGDPSSAGWHGGWLSDHLWYLRAYLWIVLLAPVFAVLARRLRVSLPAFAALVVLMEAAARHHVPLPPAGPWRVLVGDVVVYGLFVTLGMAYQARRRPLATGALIAGAAVAGIVAAAGIWWLRPPGGNVNASYPAVALTGVAWVLAAGAARRPVAAVAGHPKVAAVTLAVSRRAVTIYLWHPAAIVTSYVITDRWLLAGDLAADGRRSLASGVLVLLSTVVLTALAVAALGRVEGLAAGRGQRESEWRSALGRFSLAGPALALALAVLVPLLAVPVAGGPAATRQPGIPPPPSYREPLADSAFAGHDHPGSDEKASGPWLPGDVRRALEDWREGHPSVRGVAVGVGRGGEVWTGEAAARRSREPLRVDDRYAVASLTKSFTLALVLQQAHRGTIDLDAPVPVLAGLPELPPGVVITPRQLLQHTSGLVDYSEARAFDRLRLLTPHGAVAGSLRSGLLHPPGTAVHYSSTNYLYLGLVLEHVTGRSYVGLLGDLTSSLGLTSTNLDTATVPGRVGYAAAGVRSTVRELAEWTQALFEPGRVVPAEYVAAMTGLGPLNMGLGTWPVCPCSSGSHGEKRVTAMGHYVADGGMYRFGDGTTLVVRLQPAGAVDEPALIALGQQLRRAIPG